MHSRQAVPCSFGSVAQARTAGTQHHERPEYADAHEPGHWAAVELPLARDTDSGAAPLVSALKLGALELPLERLVEGGVVAAACGCRAGPQHGAEEGRVQQAVLVR